MSNQKPLKQMLQGFVVSHKWDLVDGDDVGGLQALGTLLDLELDLLAFFQVLEAIALDSAEVDEDVRAAFALNEAITLAPIEPFDCAGDTF